MNQENQFGCVKRHKNIILLIYTHCPSFPPISQRWLSKTIIDFKNDSRVDGTVLVKWNTFIYTASWSHGHVKKSPLNYDADKRKGCSSVIVKVWLPVTIFWICKWDEICIECAGPATCEPILEWGGGDTLPLSLSLMYLLSAVPLPSRRLPGIIFRYWLQSLSNIYTLALLKYSHCLTHHWVVCSIHPRPCRTLWYPQNIGSSWFSPTCPPNKQR